MRTELRAEKASFTINHADKILAIGSCFAENIGKKLNDVCIDTLINPFGIVYNPLSIAEQLRYLTHDLHFDENDISFHNELYFSYLFHSGFNKTNKTLFLDEAKNAIATAKTHLKTAKILLITLGTAQVFFEQKNHKAVANCHKLPSANFSKRRIDVSEIIAELGDSIENLKQKNADLQIIFSISPVRYLREGMIESQRSKARLILAVEDLCKKYPHCHYFPAYEYLLDDLRDYRFYADDYLHPNTQAINYIWQKFAETFFSTATIDLNRQITKVKQAQNHTALHPETVAHQRFLANLENEIADLTKENIFIKK